MLHLKSSDGGCHAVTTQQRGPALTQSHSLYPQVTAAHAPLTRPPLLLQYRAACPLFLLWNARSL